MNWWNIRRIAFLFGSLSLTSSVQGQIVVRQPVAPMRILGSETSDQSSRSLAALDLAKHAAEDGIVDVSMDAVKRALKSGPPVSTQALGGLLSGSRQTTSSSAPRDTDQSQAKVAEKLLAVDDVWMSKECDPQQCYLLWRDLVFPPDKKTDAFAFSMGSTQGGYTYSVQLKTEKPKQIASGLDRLVRWADKAGQVDDLQQLIRQRQEQPLAASVIRVLRTMRATEPTDREALCHLWSQQTPAWISDKDAPLAAQSVAKLLESMSQDSEARTQLCNAILDGVSKTEGWAKNEWLTYVVSTEVSQSLNQGDAKRFRKCADALLSLLEPLRSGNASYFESQIQGFYSEAANKAIAAQHLDLAIECIKEASKSGNYSSSVSNLVRPNTGLINPLLKLSTERRFETLSEFPWQLPSLGLANHGQLAPSDEVPERFLDAYKRYQKRERLPLEAVTNPASHSISLLEWVMRDALALGRSDIIEEKLKRLQTSSSDDAVLANLIWAKAQDMPVDLGSLVSKNKQGKQVLMADAATKRAALPVDLDLARQAINAPKYRELGIELAERIGASEMRHPECVTGRWHAAMAMVDDDPLLPTSHTLKHFVHADDYTQGNVLSGRPLRSFWIKDAKEDWKHVGGPSFSNLLLKYPLAGQFEITLDMNDLGRGYMTTVTIGGLQFSFNGERNLAIARIFGRMPSYTTIAGENLQNLSLNRGTKNSFRFIGDSETNTIRISCNGGREAVVPRGLSEVPFFGFQSSWSDSPSFTSLQVSGDATIPRHVDLSQADFLGWSGYFKENALPNFPITAKSASIDAPKNDAPKNDDPKKPVDLPYDWHMVDGVIESVRHNELQAIDRENGHQVSTPKWPKREHWLYYLRPLQSDEQVEFEFYQEEGKYSLHPTLDRIAVSAKDSKPRLHWITSDSGNWYGSNAASTVAAPEDDVLGPMELKEKDWNQVVVRREGNDMVLSINGADIYKQVVDKNLDGRFGFLHDPTLFHARVRNVKLSGDWPEKLPENLFETN